MKGGGKRSFTTDLRCWFAAVIAVLALNVVPVQSFAGSFPELRWGSAGGPDWASGYVISYGFSPPAEDSLNKGERRRIALERALKDASRRLYRNILNLRVEGNLTVREYLGDDQESRDSIRRRTSRQPPWEIRIEPDESIRVALKIPMGGEGGIADMIGEPREDRPTEGRVQAEATGIFPGDGIEKASGVVLLASGRKVYPSLRPRLLGPGGEVLMDFGGGSAEAKSRPALVAYYRTVGEALADRVVGNDPLIVNMTMYRERGTDIEIPSVLTENYFRTPDGMKVLRDMRIVVVLQQD